MILFGGIGILLLVLYFVVHFLVEAYENCTDSIKEVIKSEKEMALKRMWEEKNGTPFIPKKEEPVILEWENLPEWKD